MSKFFYVLLFCTVLFSNEKDEIIDKKEMIGAGERQKIYVYCIRGNIFYANSYGAMTQVTEYVNGYYRPLSCKRYKDSNENKN